MKPSLTTRCIVGLLLGIAAGALLPRLLPGSLDGSVAGADLAIRAWTNALRMVVTPLVAVQLFVAVSPHQAGKGEAAALGLGIPAVFLGLLVLTMAAAVGLASGLLATSLVNQLSLAGLTPAAASSAATGARAASGSWIDDVIPSNIFAAAARPEAILGLMLFSLAFALAARRLGGERQQLLVDGARAVRDTLFVLVEWLLYLAPVLILALAFRSTINSGLAMGRLLLWYIGIELVVLAGCILLLYPVSALLGGVSLKRFAQAAFPAQVTAAASRSSLATVPVLLRTTEETLGLPARVTALVIPIAGATLKLSRAVSSPVKFLFLAHFLGLSVGPGQLLMFCATILLLSPSTAGVPSVMSGSRSLPAFVAVGIAPEYVILFGATTAVIDVVLTVLNATGYLSASVLVSRLVALRGGGHQGAEAQTPAERLGTTG